MNTNDIKVIREATEYIRDYAKSTSPELLSKYAEDAISALDRLEAQQVQGRASENLPPEGMPVEALCQGLHGEGWMPAFYGRAKTPSEPIGEHDLKVCWRHCNTEDEVNSTVKKWRPLQHPDIAKLIEAGDAMAKAAMDFLECTPKQTPRGDLRTACSAWQAAKSSAPAQQPRVRYRSKVSGMWYETLGAAGDVDCVEVDGVQFCQENTPKCLTQQPKRLTDEDIERIANYESEFPKHFGDGLRYARDNGYLGGLSVEDAMDVLEDAVNDMDDLRLGKREHMSLNDYRARLTAKLNGTLS